MYHPYSGITNNQSESLNHVLKQLQEWSESPLDCMILALNHLQSYNLVEIVHGQHGIGKYHLHPQYRKLVNTQPLPVENVYSPEQIVERIKGNLQETTTEKSAPKPHKPPKALSQRDCAKRLIEGKKICFEPSLHTFTVIGSEEHQHVPVHPQPTVTTSWQLKCALGWKVTVRRERLTSPNSEEMSAAEVKRDQAGNVPDQETVTSSLHQTLK